MVSCIDNMVKGAAGQAIQNMNLLYGLDAVSYTHLDVYKRQAYEGENRPVDNLLLCSHDIERVGLILSEQDAVQRIYINFCNPWPKPKHWKKRLTHPRQLMNYRAFLKDGGEIRFKTDDADLFESSLGYFRQCGFTVTFLTLSLIHISSSGWCCCAC